MIDLIELTNAFAAKLQAIPEVVALLGGDPGMIIGYIDSNPTRNSTAAAIYQMKPGSVLIMWQDSSLTQGDVEGWVHRFLFFVRAMRNQSALDLIKAIVNGTPVPGDGQRWRYCAVMDGVYPTNIIEITRPTDEEGVDYYSILSETREIGDA